MCSSSSLAGVAPGRWRLTAQLVLDLLEGLALGLGHEEEDEDKASGTDGGEEPEAGVGTRGRFQGRVILGHNERHQPVEQAGAAASDTCNIKANLLVIFLLA